MTAPIEKTLRVPLGPDAAFELFTDGLDSWWPSESHSISARTGALPRAVTVEPQAGGRIYETLPDGRRADWATITEWAPGQRLAFDWYVGRPEEEATQVLVTFLPDGPGTRIELIHDGFDGLADGATMQGQYRSGWDVVLVARFGTAALARAA